MPPITTFGVSFPLLFFLFIGAERKEGWKKKQTPPRKWKHPKSCAKTKTQAELVKCPDYFWRKPSLKLSCLDWRQKFGQAQLTGRPCSGAGATTNWPLPEGRIKHYQPFPALDKCKRKMRTAQCGRFHQRCQIFIPLTLLLCYCWICGSISF